MAAFNAADASGTIEDNGQKLSLVPTRLLQTENQEIFPSHSEPMPLLSPSHPPLPGTPQAKEGEP